MINKIISISVFMAMSVVGFAQPLEHFVELARENHPEIKSRELQIEAREKTVDQSSAWQDPVLSAGYNVVPHSMEKANVSLMQNFSWFGTVKHQKAAASAFAKSETYNLLSAIKQLEIEVATVYFEIGQNKELQELQQENVQLYQQLEDFANNNLSTAKGSMVDVIRAQLAKEEAQTQIEILQQKQQSLIRTLNNLTGRETDANVQIEPVVYTAVSVENELENHPEISAVEARIDATNEAAKAAQKEAMPQFGIGVEYMRMDYMDDKPLRNEFMPMVSISLPIYRKKYKAKIAEAELMAQSYEFEKQGIQNRLLRQRIELKNRLDETVIEMELYNRQIQKSSQAKELLLNYYATSGSDFTEVLKLAQEELNYRTKWIETNTEALTLSRQWEYLNDFKTSSNSK